MNIQSISCVYFSPTGTTKTIVENISDGIKAEHIEMIDITNRSRREELLKFKNELVILATPVYYGRVPETVASYFSKSNAEQTAAVLVVVYGNRDYDDALKELHDLAVTRCFIPVAGGVFIAEHSYSTAANPIAQGRPNSRDLKKAREFGAAIQEKLQDAKSLEDLPSISTPGQIPYIEPLKLNMIKKARSTVALTPETDISICSQCGQCAEVCPTGAISPDDVTQTDRWRCLICFACIKNCPEGARQMNDPHFQAAITALQKMYRERREPEWYL